MPSHHAGTPTATGAGFAVSCASVRKVYRSGNAESVTGIDRLSLDVPAGTSLAIGGRSGSGKSTLLQLIGGIDLPDSGSITVGGTTITQSNDKQRAAFRRTIGFVFQRFYLLPTLSALDNVIAPVLPYRSGFDKQARARELLIAVGLAERTTHLPSQLSGGEQQRVAIARALINHPGLLLADEPTGNLDTHTSTDIVNLLVDLHEQRHLTMLIATHDIDVANRCQRQITLTDGVVDPS
jgi:putative ABC transport system ATP-binding protein